MRLGTDDQGAHDHPPFWIHVFKDGCYRREGRLPHEEAQGAVEPRVVFKLLQDAESLGLAQFADAYHIEDNPVPDLELHIRCGKSTKAITYSPVLDDYRAQLARERGCSFAAELFVTHLIAGRVLDMVGSWR